MALSQQMFSDVGGAVNDLFGAVGAYKQAGLNAQALKIKAAGDIAEAQQYDLAQKLALQNEQFTKTSTAIKEAQQARETTMQIGGQQAAISGAGFAESGSALDILRSSASQGAMTQAVLGQQGLISEAGYEEQAQSYGIMSSAAQAAAAQETQMAEETKGAGTFASIGDIAGGLIKGAAAIAML